MFFQRFYKRKKKFYSNKNDNNYREMHNYNDDIDTSAAAKTRQENAYTSPKHRAATQLTPLWEHILRTRTLPEHICPSKIYAEFHERLRDPEWQVRQHALRVLVDVLVVMRQAADAYMQTLIAQLVENLGHAAPTIRKGALDCLRVYLMETARPEKIMQQILHIGLDDCLTNEPFGGRLTCGVLLSIPALLQSTLQSEQRALILENTINILLQKMQLLVQQEIILKVLWKLCELLGEHEFRQFMSAKTYRDLQLLTNMYNVQRNDKRAANWQAERASEMLWRASSTEEEQQENVKLAKVIMETEIKINDDTLTMRLLEADENLSSAAENSENLRETEVIYGNASKSEQVYSVLNSYSDSEVEELNVSRQSAAVRQPLTPQRTPKRVTFGGAIIKVRTPDSDAAAAPQNKLEATKLSASLSTITEQTNAHKETDFARVLPLSVEIPNDNTKPLASEAQKTSPNKSPSSLSPRLTHKRLSISSIESNVSPKTPHKEIEVLHNLQRDPSPARVKRLDILSPTSVFGEAYTQRTQNEATQTGLEQVMPKTWEELDIVDNETLFQLKSAVSTVESFAISRINFEFSCLKSFLESDPVHVTCSRS